MGGFLCQITSTRSRPPIDQKCKQICTDTSKEKHPKHLCCRRGGGRERGTERGGQREGRERQRDRDRQRERETETDRERHRQTDRQADRQTETEKEESRTESGGEKDKQMLRQKLYKASRPRPSQRENLQNEVIKLVNRKKREREKFVRFFVRALELDNLTMPVA